MKNLLIFSAIITLSVTAGAAVVTGDPSVDSGWTLAGHSLSNGVYVKGSANYGFNAYGTGFAVESGSNLEIADGSFSWVVGDTVVGVGGVFQSITAPEAGWGSIGGNAVNSLLSSTSGPKLQVKFGTSDAAWSTSTAAPGSGNGNSSSSAGGGRIQIRTSGWNTDSLWAASSGQLLPLEENGHILWDNGSVDYRAARAIWNFDAQTGQVTSWQLLLNVSMLARLNPGYAGLLPSIGDAAIMTVQNGDSSSYTDAMVTTIPEPATMVLLGLGGLLCRRFKRA